MPSPASSSDEYQPMASWVSSQTESASIILANSCSWLCVFFGCLVFAIMKFFIEGSGWRTYSLGESFCLFIAQIHSFYSLV